MGRREMGKGTVAVGSVANKAGRQKEVELPKTAIKKLSEYYIVENYKIQKI
jgi:hypothetical protein